MSLSASGYRELRPGDPGLGVLLPEGVVAVETVGEVTPEPLFPDEESHVAKAVESRRLEFARGRTCARRAMAALGLAPVAVPADANRAPRWPAGVLGSITHTHAYCAAAVARTGRWASIGIDAEGLRPLEPGVQTQILLADERRQLAALDPTTNWPCVVFSIKEAIYKARFPIEHRWLDFHDVQVVLDAANGRFEAHVLGDPASRMEGRYVLVADHVLAALVI